MKNIMKNNRRKMKPTYEIIGWVAEQYPTTTPDVVYTKYNKKASHKTSSRFIAFLFFMRYRAKYDKADKSIITK